MPIGMSAPTFSLNAIREAFLDYFAHNDHTVVASSSLVPDNDPTLLFTNAGMVQFKDYFTAKRSAPFPRATTAQKCVRAGGKHNDLENVGYTGRHHTFFEMLGNFSFGDYFKEQAIYHAWSFVTQGLQLSPDRLCVTVFAEDDEAFALWKSITGFPDEKIIRIATSDNFWSMGDTGPCGPCSEIFFDHGEGVAGGPPGSADADGDRFTEIWNLVFMQYEQRADGSRVPLPRPCIDTGMGLERVAAILQGKTNNFDIDLFQALISDIRAKIGVPVGQAQSCNVIADHIRSSSFLIADGVLPLNEGRGYVLRRIIRRAVRHARVLGAHEPVLYKLVDGLVSQMGHHYPELRQHQSLICKVLQDEEERFGATLDFGLKVVDEAVAQLSGKVLPGEVAFKLYDTYGFPVDLTADVLRARGITVDLVGFEQAMQQQKALSKRNDDLGIRVAAEAIVVPQQLEEGGVAPTAKRCYDSHMELQANVVWSAAGADGMVHVLLDQTPFFAESGGQVGDTGSFTVPGEAPVAVEQTYNVTHNGKTWIVHICRGGNFPVGQRVDARVDAARRRQIAAHHSATHLLQAALRRQLGEHVTQKGSSVDAARLRFDFTHTKDVAPEELRAVEELVNAIILQATPAVTLELARTEAEELGALALFGEKYGEKVRVVRLGADEHDAFFSQELCGGTHVSNTGQIGSFHIVSQSGVAAGVRRIEAVCGEAFRNWALDTIGQQAQTASAQHDAAKQMQKRIAQLESEVALQQAEVHTVDCSGQEFVAYRVSGQPMQQLRAMAQTLSSARPESILAVIGTDEGAVACVLCVGGKVEGNVSAHEAVQDLCQRFGGRGGGKKAVAQCGDLAPGSVQAVEQAIAQYITTRRAS